MCEQTPVEYKNGDIVWVKLGSCWWPGEVQDFNNIPEETIAAFKKPVIAAVKFFDEDCYEFIKSIDRIYSYNCSKKNEFIKKGLDLHRAKHDYMKKFPEDVSKAEERTNGNPNIIDDPIFAPEKKSNIAALIFGTPKQKKSPKKSIGSGRKSFGSKSPSNATKTPTNRIITHPRFLGHDDHEVRILVQSPEQMGEPEEEEKVLYKCLACGFSTERVDVSIMHHKSHIQGLFFTSPSLKNRSPTKRNRKNKMTKSKTKSIIEDLDLIEKGLFLETHSSDDEIDSEPKRKRKRTKKPKTKDVPEKSEITTIVDIRGDLLAEWDDEDSDEDKGDDTSNITLDEPINLVEQNHKEPEPTISIKKDDKSCFDFDEDDEDEIVGTSIGRKIPRVIPPPDRPKSVELDIINSDISRSENLDLSIKSPLNVSCSSEDTTELGKESDSSSENPAHLASDGSHIDSTLNRNEILKIIHQVDESVIEENLNKDLDKENEKLVENERIEDLDMAFKDILEATTVPDLPEIPHSLKFEQNFHDSKTIKFPDKIIPDIPVKTEPEMSAKLINPKKRFVKSFEDFEQQIHNEQKKMLQLEQVEKVLHAIQEPEEIKPCTDVDVNTASVVEQMCNKEVHQESELSTVLKQTEPAKIESVVEVAKLKTQLKNKLENFEYLEDNKPKRPRLLRDRILSSHKEEIALMHEKLPKDFDLIDTHFTATSELASVTTLSQATSTLPEDLLESEYTLKKIENKENVQTELLSVIKTVEISDGTKSNNESNAPPDKMEENIESVASVIECTKPRRLSIKMSEINETPFEIKETTELLQVEEKVKIEPTQVIDSKETIHVMEAEQLMETETATTLHKTLEEVEPLVLALKSEESEPLVLALKSEESEPISIVEENSVIHEVPLADTEQKTVSPTVIEEHSTADVTSETISETVKSESSISFSNTPLENQNITEDLSALTTLATISELTTNLDINSALVSEKSKIIEDNLTSLDKSNLNFVTMDDLAEGQVEISDVSVTKRKTKPINLLNFSVDFGDSNEGDDSLLSNEKITPPETSVCEEDINQPDSIEMSLGKVFEGETETDDSYTSKGSSQMADSHTDDLDEQIPSLIVCNNSKQLLKKMKKDYSEKLKPPEYSSSSKLLEILTDGKPKSSSVENTLPSKIVPTSFKESPSFNKILLKPKDEKFFITKESGPFKHLFKSKDIFTEVPITKPLSKPKDDKLYTISKDISTVTKTSKYENKSPKFIPKSSSTLKPFSPLPLPSKTNKPIILSEKIIKTLSEPTETVSVQKVTSKRTTQDVEDIDTFIIQKPPKKIAVKEEDVLEAPLPKKAIAPRGKAKILQQTIIKPASELTQQTVGTPLDDGMFDINSMPIVLGDQILTTEGIEKMPVLSEGQETLAAVVPAKTTEQRVLISNKTPTTQPVILKTYATQKLSKPRLYQAGTTSTTKILKSSPAIISRQTKQDKYIILPTSSTSTSSKYTVGKRQSTSKKITPVVLPTATITHKIQGASSSEPSGNKIMIVTNQQGQQSRVLLTPAQQKLFGYQTAGSKLVKSTLKGNILQKTSVKTSNISSLTTVSPASKISHAVVNSQGEVITTTQNVISTEPILVPVKGTPLRAIKSDHTKLNRKFQIQQQKVSLQEGFNTLKGSSLPGQQKTIVIKNQQGQIVKKFQGTDDAYLEQQVAEQVQAIKASGTFSSLNVSNKIKTPIKRSYPKKLDAHKSLKLVANSSKILKNEAIPPLAPISPKNTDPLLLSQTVLKSDSSTKSESTAQKSLNQLIIQDALGNQTTIMEGQILALPSGETVDGQPQSYMLVTLDESGNLAPLNNEALLSLDPNLTLGGDLSNMVLQVDEGAAVSKKQIESKKLDATMITTENEEIPKMIEETPEQPKAEALSEKLEGDAASNVEPQQNMQTVTCSIGNDPNQQLIITGDPITTQKFIESLTEGNPDLANLLASAEGNILIQTDEQQILINANSENQVLLPINTERLDSSESDSNPIFATQPMKNQDILAAALADTDVFQQEQTVSPIQNKLGQSQLSPNSGLYQAGVSNVLETTLSLSSPIMTPLEVPSTNNKKIPDEEMDILTTEVPKNVDLPITITDPNISQTVAQQQVVSLITNELTSNLDLPLTISDQVVPLTSTEMHSPSFGYPLSSLDESVTNVDVQKSFSGPISMPLLTEEDPQVSTITESIVEESEVPEDIIEEKPVENVPVESCEVEGESVIRSVNKETEVSSSIEERTSTKREELFESSALTDSIIKDDAKSPSKNFLGTTMESEEGLCTLGGAMCSSLSEPPPDMFDLSLVGAHFVTEAEIKNSISSGLRTDSIESSVIQKSPSMEKIMPTNETNENSEVFNKYDNYNVENKIDNSLLTAPSDSSSPVVNVDENSCEIPVQPQIVTDLSSSSFESVDVSNFESTKTAGDDVTDENSDRSKMKFD